MDNNAKTVYICCDTGCLANGDISRVFKEKLGAAGARLAVGGGLGVKETGCHGLCEFGPVVKIMPDGVSYYRVKPSDVDEIIQTSVAGDGLVERLLYKAPDGGTFARAEDNPFYKTQKKVALRNVGEVAPLRLDDYKARGGYRAFEKALEMPSERIINEMMESGLRGRGGAGFPTGLKWKNCLPYEETPKYVICNCDEGDPGAFMDRGILEGDPHSVIEGMLICALAIGASEAYIYVRDEYEQAVRHAVWAIQTAEEAGIFAMMPFPFTMEVVRGGGAFVCGESTALINSIEGRVGEPRGGYTLPVAKGLFGKPTVVNNVETFANVPVIIEHGAAKFRETGTEGSPGTKVFTLVGKVRRTGLVEIPMGATLRHLIFDVGGGITGGRAFKAVQIGGPSGGCMPESLLDVPIDFDTLGEHGGMMGSGGMIVLDDRTCMAEFARYYIDFLSGESCGKCTPCREGLKKLGALLTNICEGRGTREDVELIRQTCHTVAAASLCALGRSAPNPVLTALEYFPEEFTEHIERKRCPTGVCKALTEFRIDEDKCVGCGLCAKDCPASCIEGEKKQPHSIRAAACVKCGLCREVCKHDAVTVV